MRNALLLFVLVWLSACSTVPQRLDADKFYRRDLPFCVDDLGCFEGVTVLPEREVYNFEIEPKGGANIDLLLATTCHREDSFEKTDRGWFIFKNKKRFEYHYRPVDGLEDTGICPLRVNTYEKELGRHSWSLMFFEHPRFKLPAKLTCNGVTSHFNGVSACQSKVGLIQQIDFGRPVEWASSPAGCAKPEFVKSGLYRIALEKGECVHIIRDGSENYHQFGTVGYEGVLVRNE